MVSKFLVRLTEKDPCVNEWWGALDPEGGWVRSESIREHE